MSDTEEDVYVQSAETGRLVKPKGSDGRKTHYAIPQSSIPWREEAPMTRETRRKLHEQCPSEHCFLMKTTSKTGKVIYKYPVCTGGDDCELHCAGLLAAHKATFRVTNRAEALLRTTRNADEKAHLEQQIADALKARSRAVRILKEYCKA
jgi:hypothetical protein